MGTLLGMLAGLLVGGWCIYHFEVSGALNQVCLMAGIFMLFQLLGATIGATIGKPHSIDSQNMDSQNTDSQNTDSKNTDE